MVASESVRYLVCISGLEKLGCLWHESPCSSKQIQENVVRLKICALATLGGTRVHLILYFVVHQIKYGKMKPYNKILQFPHVRAERLSKKKKLRYACIHNYPFRFEPADCFCSKFITVQRWIQEPHNI